MATTATTVLPWTLGMFVLQICVGLMFIYLGKVTFERVQVDGWQYIQYVGYVLVAWSFLSINSHVLLPRHVLYIHSVGLLALTLAYLGMVVQLVYAYLPDLREWYTLRNMVWYVVLVVAVFRVSGGIMGDTFREMMTMLYFAAPLIAMPAAYGVYRLHLASGTRTSLAFWSSGAMLLTGHVLNVYATGACGRGLPFDRCVRYIYDFSPVISLPAQTYVVAAAVCAPAVIFVAFLLWGYGQYTFFHHTRLRQYVLNAVKSIEETAGRAATGNIVSSANQNTPGVVLQFQDGTWQIYAAKPVTWSTVEQIEENLISAFGQYVVPEKRSEAEDAMTKIHRDLDDEHAGDPLEHGVSNTDRPLCPLRGDNRGQPQIGPREQIIVILIIAAATVFTAVWLR